MGLNEVKYEYFDNGNIKSEYWYNSYRRLNRKDGPAIVYYNENGNILSEQWYKDGNYYREDGKDSQLMLLPDIITLTHKEMEIAHKW